MKAKTPAVITSNKIRSTYIDPASRLIAYSTLGKSGKRAPHGSFICALLCAVGGEFFGELFAHFKKCRVPAKFREP
jgi:hypothetical protein